MAKSNKKKNKKAILIPTIFGLMTIIYFVCVGLLIAYEEYFSIFYILPYLVMVGFYVVSAIKLYKYNKSDKVNSNELNNDDIIILSYQNILLYDVKITDGTVLVDESSYSGSIEPILKKVGDIVHKGSYVLSGDASSRVIKKEDFDKPKSKKKIKIKFVYILIIVLMVLTMAMGAATLVYYLLHEYEPSVYITPLVTLIISILPIGLCPLLSFSYLKSAIYLQKSGIDVLDIYNIDEFKESDVVCFDKTGTLTDKNYKVAKIETFKENETYIKSVLFHVLNATGDKGRESSALLNIASSTNRLTPNAILEYDLVNNYIGASFSNGTFLLGSPEKMNLVDKSLILRKVQEYKIRGYAAVVLAKGKDKITGKKYENQCETLAILVLEEQIRDSADVLIKYLNDQNKVIKIITGDNPLVASEIAKSLNIEYADKYVSLVGIKDEEIKGLVSNYTVFGGASAHQKAIVISCLKELGHKVAMVGDGENDIEAFEVSDYSISLSGTGSQVVSNNNSLNSVVYAYDEATIISNKINIISSLFLTKSISLFLINLVFLVLAFINNDLMMISPFMTGGFYILDILIIGIPSMILAFDNDIENNFNKLSSKLSTNIFTSSLIMFIGLLIIYMFYIYGKINGVYTSVNSLANATNIAYIYLIAYSLFISFKFYLPFTDRGLLTWITSTLEVLCLIGVQLVINLHLHGTSFMVFDFSTLSAANYLLLGSVTLGSVVLFYVINYIIEVLKGKTEESSDED